MFSKNYIRDIVEKDGSSDKTNVRENTFSNVFPNTNQVK